MFIFFDISIQFHPSASFILFIFLYARNTPANTRRVLENVLCDMVILLLLNFVNVYLLVFIKSSTHEHETDRAYSSKAIFCQAKLNKSPEMK